MIPKLSTSTLFPYTTLFRSDVREGGSAFDDQREHEHAHGHERALDRLDVRQLVEAFVDREHAAAAEEEKRHDRSEEHTSELQSPCNLVCRLLLEKKKLTKLC